MSIFFEESKQIFYLESKNVTYAIGIHPEGFVQHLYYGKRIGRDELRHLVTKNATNHALKLPNTQTDTYCQHIMAEAPAYGRGDFREPMFSVRTPGGDRLAEPVFESYRIHAEKPMPNGLPALRQGETLELILKDRVLPLRLRLFYTVYEDVATVARRAEWENMGKEPLYLDRAYSCSFDLPGTEYDAVTLHGAWARECEVDRTPLHRGVTTVDSKRGISSAGCNPFIAMAEKTATEESGQVYGINLVYSGSFALKAEVVETGMVRLLAGVNDHDFCWKLNPAEVFSSPEAVLVYSEHGLGGLSRTYHDTYRNYLINPGRVFEHRPVLLNCWEGTYFKFDNHRLMELIDSATGLGFDMFVLDDGWFGARVNDKAGLGDWIVNPDRFPNGLQEVIDYTHSKGMKFGLWFEPEMVNPDSDLYRAHPEWAIHCPGHDPVLGRNQLVLDITRADVRDYIVNAVSNILNTHEIDYVKWDFNRSVAENYSEALPADRQQEFHVRFTLGFYDLCERLVNGFPHIFFEGCSSGGARFDAGALYYFPQIWTSDDTDAYMRTRIQYGTSLAYPLSSHSCHVSVCPNHQTARITPFASRADIAHLGATGYELNPAALTAEELAAIPNQIAAYHEIEELVLKGDLYRLASPFDSNYFAEELVSKDRKRALITAMRINTIANDAVHMMYPKGLDENARYHIKELDLTLTGSTIMHAGLLLKFERKDFVTATWHLEQQ